MKKISFIFIALLALLVLFSCTGKEKSQAEQVVSALPAEKEGPAELTIMGGAHLVGVTEVVLRDFMKENPDIRINFEKYSYAEYPTKMKIALSQGDSTPDVMIIHDLYLRQFVKAGFLMDLTPIVDRENTLDVMEPAIYSNGLYGVPNQVTSQYVFLYRKDIYEKLGLSIPETFDDYFEQALVLKEKGYYAGAWDPSNSKCSDMFLSYLYMMGGNVLDNNGNVTLNKAEETLSLIKKCYDAGIYHKSISSDSDEYWTAFNSGVIAAFPGPATHAAYYETNVDPTGNGGYGSIGIAPSVRFSADGPSTALNNTEYWAINKNTKYPEAAKKVVSYLTQTIEAAGKFSNVNENGLMARYCTGYIPAMKDIATGAYTDGWDAFGGTNIVAELAADIYENRDSITIPFVDERSAEIKTIISDVIGEMFLMDSYTPSEAVKEMKKRIDNI